MEQEESLRPFSLQLWGTLQSPRLNGPWKPLRQSVLEHLNQRRHLALHSISVYNTHMKSAEIIKRLERDGWVLANTRGSHRQYRHPEKKGRVAVPHPQADLPIGTVRSIFKQAGWEWREK